VFVLNDASPRAKITFEAAIALSQHGTVAPVTIHHRTLFASSMIDGRTAMELEPNGQSAIEVAGLWEYINARLNFQVVPTAIGLDALNRHDGQGGAKQPFALSPEPMPRAATQAASISRQAEDYDDADEFDASIAAAKTPTPSLAQVKPVERVPDPLPREFTQAQPTQNLWDGFAPSDDDKAVGRTHAHPQNGTATHGTPRVFGRRHASA